MKESERRCLFCGLDETELRGALRGYLCPSCAPADRDALAAALAEFRPVATAPQLAAREVVARLDTHFGGSPSPLWANGCAHCGAQLGAVPLRHSTKTEVSLCAPCILQSLDGGREPSPTDWSRVLSKHRASLDAARDRERLVRRAAGPPFNPRAYEQAVQYLEGHSMTGLLLSAELFELATRCKLAQRPRLALSPREIVAGLESSRHVELPKPLLEARMRSTLEQVLPDLETFDTYTPSLDEANALGWLVAYAVCLRKAMAPSLSERVLALLQRWAPSARPVWRTPGGPPSIVDNAMNAYNVDAASLGYAMRLLAPRAAPFAQGEIVYALEGSLDYAEVLDLIVRAQCIDLRHDANTIERGLASSIVLTARHQGRLVGIVQALSDRATVIALCAIAVDAAFRGRGIARSLVTTLRETVGETLRVQSLVSDAEQTFFAHFGIATRAA